MLFMINRLTYISDITVAQYIWDYGCLKLLTQNIIPDQLNIYFVTAWIWLVVAKSQKVSSLTFNLSTESL